PDDQYITTYTVKDSRPGDAVAVGDELFVTDVTGHRVLVLDRNSGKVLRTFGSKGGEPGQFRLPNAIAADAEGNLYVSDAFNYRLQKLNRDGKPLLVKGEQGNSFGSFARPRGIAVGPDGVIYVVETQFELVQMFNQQGKVLMAFGNNHAAPGFLELPAGIATDTSCLPYFMKYVDPRFEPEYLIFVVSQVGRAKVGVYAFGKFKPGVPPPTLLKSAKPPIPPAKGPAIKPPGDMKGALPTGEAKPSGKDASPPKKTVSEKGGDRKPASK
ncbi:hypothetical protein HQ576_00795, partial [bacterium]|nr:hypothetical protein [bacterium]